MNYPKIFSFSEILQKFSAWLNKAVATKEIVEPTAMCLATVNKKGQPSSRMILLKKFDERGFCFFTNLTSAKGEDLLENQNVALCFYWGILGLQVRIEGMVEKVAAKEADDYFASRRRGSQIGAWASKQSHEIQNWEEFQERISKITKDFAGQEIPRPPFWSGFRVIPRKIEFWEEGEFRIHQREAYLRLENNLGWEMKKLYP